MWLWMMARLRDLEERKPHTEYEERWVPIILGTGKWACIQTCWLAKSHPWNRHLRKCRKPGPTDCNYEFWEGREVLLDGYSKTSFPGPLTNGHPQHISMLLTIITPSPHLLKLLQLSAHKKMMSWHMIIKNSIQSRSCFPSSLSTC